jgi:hypothetical protein
MRERCVIGNLNFLSFGFNISHFLPLLPISNQLVVVFNYLRLGVSTVKTNRDRDRERP